MLTASLTACGQVDTMPTPLLPLGDLGACTGSMRPMIQCGDTMLLEPVTGVIGLGDVVVVPNAHRTSEGGFACTFPTFPATVLHRVIALHEQDGQTYVETQGDNAIRPDPCYVPLKRVHRILTGIVHNRPPVDTGTHDLLYDRWLVSWERYSVVQADYMDGRTDYDTVMLEYGLMAADWRMFEAERQRVFSGGTPWR